MWNMMGSDAFMGASLDAFREQAERARSVRDQLAGFVAEAESRDKMVKVRVSSSGLEELVINPRAMRKQSAELAADITETIRQADSELRRQQQEATTGLGTTGVNLDKALEHLNAMRDSVTKSHGDMLRTFETIQQQTRG
jgi:DNA-binding protein YbaB